jgi:hypothetical protein
VATAQDAKQIKLTEKHIQGFIAVSEDMAKLYDGANPDIVVSLDCGSACRHDGTAEWREPCALVSEYQIRHAI